MTRPKTKFWQYINRLRRKADEFYTKHELIEMGFKKVGEDVRISRKAVIRCPEEITLGNHIAIDPFVYISVKMDIGNYVHIPPFTGISGSKKSYCRFEDYTFTSEGCKLICGSDNYAAIGLLNPTVPKRFRVPVTLGKIILKKFSGVGANVTIFPNITIGEGSLVGACSLVTKSLEPWGIYVGTPVKRVKDRKGREILLEYDRKIKKSRKKEI